MAKRPKTSAARRATIKRLYSKVESLTFELKRVRKALDTELVEWARDEGPGVISDTWPTKKGCSSVG